MKPLLCRMGQALRAVACCELGKQYELSLALYPDVSSSTPECSHTLSGESRHPLWKLALLFGGVAVTVTLLGTLCALVRPMRK